MGIFITRVVSNIVGNELLNQTIEALASEDPNNPNNSNDDEDGWRIGYVTHQGPSGQSMCCKKHNMSTKCYYIEIGFCGY